MRLNPNLILPGCIVSVGILVAALFGSDAPRTSGSADTGSGEAVRIGYFPNLTHAPALVANAEGIWDKELAPNHIEPKVMNAGPEAMEALLAGALDFTYVGPSPAINAYIKSDGSALRVISGACDGGAALVARPDAGIESIRDLDGKRLAVPQLGGTQDVSARHFLHEVGLRSRLRGGTVQIMPVKNADMIPLYKSKQIDAAWVPEPWASRFQFELGAKLVADERDLWKGRPFPTTILVVRSEYATRHPEVVDAVLRAHRAAMASLNSQPSRTKAECNAELGRLTGHPLAPEVLDMAWSRLRFTEEVSVNALDSQAAAAVESAYLKPGHISLAGMLDQRITEKRK